jgi:hypothetical protein
MPGGHLAFPPLPPPYDGRPALLSFQVLHGVYPVWGRQLSTREPCIQQPLCHGAAHGHHMSWASERLRGKSLLHVILGGISHLGKEGEGCVPWPWDSEPGCDYCCHSLDIWSVQPSSHSASWPARAFVSWACSEWQGIIMMSTGLCMGLPEGHHIYVWRTKSLSSASLGPLASEEYHLPLV